MYSFLALLLFQILLSTGAWAQKSELLDSASRIAKKVSSLRGLAEKYPIKRAVMNKEQILERLKVRINEEYTPEQVLGESWSLKRLGLLAPSADYMETLLNLLKDQVAGFYDPFEKHLYIASWVTIGNDFVMAHEITHALQDQHFGLKKFLSAAKKNNDAALARQALVEGDGMAASIEFLMDAAGRQAPWGQDGFTKQFVDSVRKGVSDLKDVPMFLRESLTFPYSEGLSFVAFFRQHHSWAKVDSVFRNPPLSTEHVMHPEKYVSGEKPHAVKVSKLPLLSTFKVASENNMGEFGLKVFLQQHGLSEKKAADAAAGWGGDRWKLFAPKTQPIKSVEDLVGVLAISWDTETDALEFMEAMEVVLPKWSGGTAETKDKVLLQYTGTSGQQFIAERKKTVVLVAAGNLGSPAKNAKLRRQIWGRLKIKPFPKSAKAKGQTREKKGAAN